MPTPTPKCTNGLTVTVTLEQLSPRDLQQAIVADSEASDRLLDYLDERGLPHSEEISGSALAAVCGVDGRTWRRWVGGDREMPVMARRLLVAAAWCVVAEDE